MNSKYIDVPEISYLGQLLLSDKNLSVAVLDWKPGQDSSNVVARFSFHVLGERYETIIRARISMEDAESCFPEWTTEAERATARFVISRLFEHKDAAVGMALRVGVGAPLWETVTRSEEAEIFARLGVPDYPTLLAPVAEELPPESLSVWTDALGTDRWWDCIWSGVFHSVRETVEGSFLDLIEIVYGRAEEPRGELENEVNRLKKTPGIAEEDAVELFNLRVVLAAYDAYEASAARLGLPVRHLRSSESAGTPHVAVASVARFPKAQTAKTPRTRRKIGRNQPCPCNSGRKYKRCCGAN